MMCVWVCVRERWQTRREAGSVLSLLCVNSDRTGVPDRLKPGGFSQDQAQCLKEQGRC